mmetsp:Transcript_23409/g.35512  ORF Transcript_23409/g.35512 Transcript_23409/m.35512 type:complete len:111 (+) Transcript_23409:282-614(+)
MSSPFKFNALKFQAAKKEAELSVQGPPPAVIAGVGLASGTSTLLFSTPLSAASSVPRGGVKESALVLLVLIENPEEWCCSPIGKSGGTRACLKRRDECSVKTHARKTHQR